MGYAIIPMEEYMALRQETAKLNKKLSEKEDALKRAENAMNAQEEFLKYMSDEVQRLKIALEECGGRQCNGGE